jgi:hypothetical protein
MRSDSHQTNASRKVVRQSEGDLSEPGVGQRAPVLCSYEEVLAVTTNQINYDRTDWFSLVEL